ncbi:MAG: hypothetical protein ACRDFB_09530, partial [Rhabdochlamydiaceae bacterium]
LIDAGKTLVNPRTIELATVLFLGSKIPESTRGSSLKVSTFADIVGERRSVARAFYQEAGFSREEVSSHLSPNSANLGSLF